MGEIWDKIINKISFRRTNKLKRKIEELELFGSRR
jgi:hypothetical protein